MKAKSIGSILAASIFAVGLMAGHAIGQNKAPTEGKGIKAAEPVLVEVGGDKSKLRVRVFVVDPGGVIPLHSHKDNPTVAYYYGGPLSEFKADGTPTGERGGGKAYADDRNVNHWYENRSKETATVVVSDVQK